MIGLDVGEAEIEASGAFLRGLVASGLLRVQLRSPTPTWPSRPRSPRCSVCLRALHRTFLRDLLGQARQEQAPMLAALVRPIFGAEGRETAREDTYAI